MSLGKPTISTVLQQTCILIDSLPQIIEVSTMGSWKLLQRYEQPISGKANEQIFTIRFKANGTRLAVMLKDHLDPSRSWFELRHPYNMTVLKRIDLVHD